MDGASDALDSDALDSASDALDALDGQGADGG